MATLAATRRSEDDPDLVTKTSTDSTMAIPHTGHSTNRSIVLIGDDPMMVRALRRLLQGAGYSVAIRERDVDWSIDNVVADEADSAALTIVDVPDQWSRSGHAAGSGRWAWPTGPKLVLWLSNLPGTAESVEQCLVKPFTASQLLAKVDALFQSTTSHIRGES